MLPRVARGWILKISFSKSEESLKVVHVEFLEVLTSVVLLSFGVDYVQRSAEAVLRQ